MFSVNVPRIFKDARRVFLTESLFSTVNFHILQSVENYITCIGIFREVPVLLSVYKATKKQTPNYISGTVL